MKWRWEGDSSVTLGSFIVGFLGSYVIMQGVEVSISSIAMPGVAAFGGAYLSLIVWILMFASENLRSNKEED